MAEPSKARAAFAPWDRRELPGAFTVEESAKRVGHYKWIEMRLFEVLGGWVATVPELDVKMRLGTHCYHHAWHAELWHKRLPELREMNPDRLTLPPNDELVAFVDAMTEPEAPELTIEKLVGVYRVLIPHKIAAYTYHLNNTSTITDAPTIRSLKFALQDEFEDWRDGEMLIQSLIETPADVERAAAHQVRLETLMLAAGGIAGPGSIGGDRRVARRSRRGPCMKRMLPAEELARDERFVRTDVFARVRDPAPDARRPRSGAAHPCAPRAHPNGPGSLMHGIFTGEIQALEGAGRTCWDFPVGDGADEAPFALKLDMARQCWDEARHCEISVKLGDWMGTEIGEFAESAFLYEAACNPDPVLRLTGVNRALEGLAIDVFNTMREFGHMAGDPVLDFCEDWMLADEVTHVKMGSDWLRRLTADDPERRERALEFQRVVDKLFSLGGVRGEEDDSPIKLARRFRELAGFADDEIDEIAEPGPRGPHGDGRAAGRRRRRGRES